MLEIRIRFSCWLIEKAINFMPERFRNKSFVNNLFETGHIQPEWESNQ